MIAHFYCELADHDYARKNYSAAREHLKRVRGR
jgi:lipopolysaccharide biosynthesis regulator YciM